ncbi:sensor histidine kinase [Amphibacillus sp. Q70]|uniref:sensor histidine kinase n=1 Tax=Amphibacillus sp. Q70 TaxID=3453416 RepID=UPI003F878129
MDKDMNPTLQEVINIDILADVQKKMSNLVGISVVTVDHQGRPVGDLNNFTPFCQLVRSSQVGSKKCIECDALAEKRAFHNRKPMIYDCHYGLKDCCVPIIVDDKLLGAVLGGQVLVHDASSENPKEKFDVEQLSEELHIPKAQLEEAIEQIVVVEYDYLIECVDFYQVLANHFKEMGLKSIAQNQLLEESREKLEYEKRAKYAELKTIEAQINPHFLFNTLNSIARIAMMENADHTEEMIFNLSDLLRYNLKQIEEFPTIGDEIENIKRYLFIQKTRYQSRLTYNISVDSELLNYCLPSMILQPIVENAIIHGLEPLAKGGEVYISVRKQGNDIIIAVHDTGIGFDQHTFESLLDVDQNAPTGLGVINSHLRLKDYFGERYGLFYTQKDGYKTVAEITFPAFLDFRKYA